MEINNDGVGSTMTAALFLGTVICFAEASIECSAEAENFSYERFLHKPLGFEKYSFSDIELLSSADVSEKRQASLSPKYMMNKFNEGVRSFLEVLHNGYPVSASQVAQSMDSLRELNQSLNVSLAVFSSDVDYPAEYLQENSLNELITELRQAEKTVASHMRLVQSDSFDGEYLTLRRALAQTRARAANAQLMIDQRMVVPEVFEGRASPEGLKALADMTTERLQHMAG